MIDVISGASPRSRAKGSTLFIASIDWNSTQLFRDPQGDAYLSLRQASGGWVNHRIRSAEARNFIRNRYFELTGKAMSRQAFDETIETLEAQACCGQSATHEVHVRVAHHFGETFVDLGRADAKVVRINSDGWNMTFDCPAKFVRPAGYGELPEPLPGGQWSRLKELLGLDTDNWVLLSAFVLNVYGPGPYFGLLVDGEHGSGKTFMSESVKRLIDPVVPEKSRLPRGFHELMIEAGRNRLLVFDNTSSVKNDISDALCSLSSGGGFVTRRLYTDREACIFEYRRSFIINGIGEYANRPDLLDRCIAIHLPAMGAENRRPERDLRREFEAMRPELLGCIFDAVACAHRHIAEAVVSPRIRNADAAQWIVAGEAGLGFSEGAFVDTYLKTHNDMLADRAFNDPLVLALMQLLEWTPGRVISATVGELLELVQGEDRKPNLPATPRRLSNELTRLRSALATVGVKVELLHRSNKGRIIRITMESTDSAELFR